MLQMIVLGLIFFGVCGLGLAFYGWTAGRERVGGRVRDLQTAGPAEGSSLSDRQDWQARVIQAVAPVARLAAPAGGWEASSLRLRFLHAGLRQPAWPAVFFASKVVCALLLPAGFVIYLGLTTNTMLAANYLAVLLVLAAGGFYLPNMVLRYLTNVRITSLQDALPDAMDLMVICMEAGLSLDAAIARAAAEVRIRSRVLAEELQLTLQELNFGLKREATWRNLALRTGSDDIAALVGTLIQADRFGTNIGQALRLQATASRKHRQLRAEEAAAKIAVKLILPLIFLILPCLMIVLLGPAVMNISAAFGKIG